MGSRSSLACDLSGDFTLVCYHTDSVYLSRYMCRLLTLSFGQTKYCRGRACYRGKYARYTRFGVEIYLLV